MSEFIWGPAIIIDDQINDQRSEICEITKLIKQEEVPCIEYEHLPLDTNKFIDHIGSISFLLLDWEILPDIDPKTPSQAKQLIIAREQNNLIEFLNTIFEKTFFPVFIFTSQYKEGVEQRLEQESLFNKSDKGNRIFIENKSTLIKNDLFETIDKWVIENPTFYVLNEWDKQYTQSKNALFNDFYDLNHSWPQVLWETYEQDGVQASLGLGELITKNLHSRMAPFEFNSNLLASEHKPDKNELRKVLSGEIFIKDEGLHKGTVDCGDLFVYQKQGAKKETYLVITPQCDCIPRDVKQDDVELYLLKVKHIRPSDELNKFDIGKGRFKKEGEAKTIIFNLYDDKSYTVHLNKLKIMTYKQLTTDGECVGRLLPPYIYKVQQLHSNYISRQGLPKIPDFAVLDIQDSSSNIGNNIKNKTVAVKKKRD